MKLFTLVCAICLLVFSCALSENLNDSSFLFLSEPEDNAASLNGEPGEIQYLDGYLETEDKVSIGSNGEITVLINNELQVVSTPLNGWECVTQGAPKISWFTSCENWCIIMDFRRCNSS